MKKIAVLIVAAGAGTRMQSGVPKQYMALGSKTVLERTMDNLSSAMQAANIGYEFYIIVNQKHEVYYTTILNNMNIISGGDSRQQSVLSGLKHINKHDKPDSVMIHDAARPFISEALISRILTKAKTFDAVIPTLAINYTIKKTNGDKIKETINRSDLVEVQTPQIFSFDKLFLAHNKLNNNDNIFTDDAAIMEAMGEDIYSVDGEITNFKITTKDDIKRAELYLQSNTVNNMETRTGIGFDAHRLENHQPQTDVKKHVIKLGGLDIPFEQKLKGHSDADVMLHAIVDAILGAMARGDIGTHFPPSDAKWRGVDSAEFVKYTKKLLDDMGGKIINIYF